MQSQPSPVPADDATMLLPAVEGVVAPEKPGRGAARDATLIVHRRPLPAIALSVLRGSGEVLITLGLVVLLFAAYEVYGKTAQINNHQHSLDNQFAQSPVVTPSTPATPLPSSAPLPGSAVGRLY